MRIVSLLPSATEIVCSLGLRDQLVGVTHECDYPAGIRDLPKVTQTLIPHDATSGEIDSLVRDRLRTEKALYSLNMSVLETLSPDLIVTQSLCNVCAVAESEVNAATCALSSKPKVINLEPSCLADVLNCIRRVAGAAGLETRGETVVANLENRIRTVAERTKTIEDTPSVLLLEWIDPPFSAGHWSPELVRLAGGIEAIGVAGQRSETLQWKRVLAADPDVLIIACCGFDVERTLQERSLRDCDFFDVQPSTVGESLRDS